MSVVFRRMGGYRWHYDGFVREFGLLFDAGVETLGSSPEELGAKVKSEMARLVTLLKNISINE